MAKILYSATTSDGRETTGFVDADTSREARDKLIAQGLREVVLHQEAAISMEPAQLQGLDAAAIEKFARFELQVRSKPGLTTVLAEVVRLSAVWLAIDAAAMVWAASQQRWWLCAAFGAFLLYPLVMTIWRHRHAHHFQKMLKDFALGRWADAERSIAQLGAMRSKSEVLDFDLDVRLASIRARRGDLAGGLQLIEPWRARLAAKPGLFETRASAVYASTGDRAMVVRLMGEACAASKGEPARALDYALVLARFGNADEAAAVLAGIDSTLLPPQGKGFVLWTEGLLALRRGAAADAVARLGDGVTEFLRRSEGPAFWTSLAFCTCDHALALDAAGRREEARKALAPVLPIVLAHADKPLLLLLHKELLVPPTGG